ncbi:MAG: hypothetical protein GJ680_18535 [Alteromonadaceae bacterium]|nr:hypothetical protein [Alteromonadaceae bacterium]
MPLLSFRKLLLVTFTLCLVGCQSTNKQGASGSDISIGYVPNATTYYAKISKTNELLSVSNKRSKLGKGQEFILVSGNRYRPDYQYSTENKFNCRPDEAKKKYRICQSRFVDDGLVANWWAQAALGAATGGLTIGLLALGELSDAIGEDDDTSDRDGLVLFNPDTFIAIVESSGLHAHMQAALPLQNLKNEVERDIKNRFGASQRFGKQNYIHYVKGRSEDPTNKKRHNSFFQSEMASLRNQHKASVKRFELAAKRKAEASAKMASAKTILDQYRVASVISSEYLPTYAKAIKDGIYFTKRDITVAYNESECGKKTFFGKSCNNKTYAGKILKNDIVYVSGNYVRTLHTYKAGRKSPSINAGKYGEAYGNYRPYLKENRVSFDKVFSKYSPSRFASTYHPTKLVDQRSSWEGGLFGFIEKNPLASIVIGAAAYKVGEWATTPSPSYSSNSYSSNSSSTEDSNAAPSEVTFEIKEHHDVGGYSSLWVDCSNGKEGRIYYQHDRKNRKKWMVNRFLGVDTSHETKEEAARTGCGPAPYGFVD